MTESRATASRLLKKHGRWAHSGVHIVCVVLLAWGGNWIAAWFAGAAAFFAAAWIIERDFR